jgi:hypothetical protein
VQKGLALVEEQRVRASYTMKLKYVVETTNEVIEHKVTGIYDGFAYSSIKTDTPCLQIPGCQQD